MKKGDTFSTISSGKKKYNINILADCLNKKCIGWPLKKIIKKNPTFFPSFSKKAGTSNMFLFCPLMFEFLVLV